MAKSDTLKLPKKIAGVKVPKVLRHGTVTEFLNSPVGRFVLAEALVAAATAAAAALKNYKPVSETVSDAGTTAKDLVKDAASGLVDVAAGVVHQILPASSDAEDAEKTKGPKRDGDRGSAIKH